MDCLLFLLLSRRSVQNSTQNFRDRRQGKELLAVRLSVHHFSSSQCRRPSCRRDRRSNLQDDPERLGEIGASIVDGRRVSSRGIEPLLPKGSLATASESTATVDCRWTTSCCCDHWTNLDRSPVVSIFRSRRPATVSKNIDRSISHGILVQF